ncbi:MAG: type II toxin-antitoxin system HicA family toxin [Cyclobacteriaceae bacterium]|nr:type II toxin-antitoxin system HicA family toxin [Cyclobacteriaceae bacterium]
MKSSELLRMLLQDGWYSVGQKGSHVKLRHAVKSGVIIFPNHGNHEVGKGLEKKLLKQAGLRK